MRTGRFSFMRATPLLIVALAAMLLIFARSDNPAEATSFDPHFSASVSDPTPGANADININFSIDAPDAFVNVRNAPTTTFVPKLWGVETGAPIGAIGGSFNALATLGIFGVTPCTFGITFGPTMYVSSVDPSNSTSQFDLPGSPGGPGYSGQFAADPDTITNDPDVGATLVPFNANEFHNGSGSFGPGSSFTEAVYRDDDNSHSVSVGDDRLTRFRTAPLPPSEVQATDLEMTGPASYRAFVAMAANEKHDENVAVNGLMDVGEGVYIDVDNSGAVSIGDTRQFAFAGLNPGSQVAAKFLNAGVTHYPDFLELMFPSAQIGPPLVRLWGGQNVLVSAISLQIVTFRPGQLPGFPASMGYPTVTILLNPVAPVDLMALTLTSDLCSPLNLANTNFGVSRDNPNTPTIDEAGYALLTSPKAEKDHVFSMVTQSQPDADDDGIENWVDSCALAPNTEDIDGRHSDADDDGLDGACDPDSSPPSDFGNALVAFNADEFHNGSGSYQPGSSVSEAVYLDVDGSGAINPVRGVTAGDIRLTDWRTPASPDYRAAGTTVGIPAPSDLGVGPLVNFVTLGNNQVGNEFHNGFGTFGPGSFFSEAVYRDNDGSGSTAVAGSGVTVGDLRLTQYRAATDPNHRPAGSTVVAGDPDLATTSLRAFVPMAANEKHLEDVAVNGQMDVGEGVYTDVDLSGNVSYEDLRQFLFEGKSPGSVVGDPDQANTTTRRFVPMAANEKHDETVDASLPVKMDVGEGVYTDVDLSGDVSYNDRRQFFFQGANPNSLVQACCPSPSAPDVLGLPDEDGDNYANRADNCPVVPNGVHVDPDSIGIIQLGGFSFFVADYGALIGPNNQLDNDGDEIGNSCDPDPFTPTGHVHELTLTGAVAIGKHGVKLDDLSGPKSVASGGSAVYSVDVENKSSSDSEVAQAGLKVVEGCATVSPSSTTLSLNPDQTKTASFSVDWSGCPDGYYTVQADACHGDDPAPAGLFGVGACGGGADGKVDTNPLDDAPRSRTVKVGSP